MSTFIESFFGTKQEPKRKSKISISQKNSDEGYKGYNFKEIKKSKTEGKRYDAIFVNVKTKKEKKVSFGKQGEKDFISLQDKKMRDFYDFKNKDKPIVDLMSKQALEKYILWNKPTLESSIKDYTKRFKEKSK